MDKKENLKKLIIILIICIFIFILVSKKVSFQNLYDDILFIKSQLGANNGQEETIINSQNGKIQEYLFQIQYKNTDFHHEVNLGNTIQKETLVQEKIAPGTEGVFHIILETNQDSIYKIKFESKNEKPQNLMFEHLESGICKNSLEELQETLTGELQKGEIKVIIIHWYWPYENQSKGNKQDTEDSQKIKTYEFNIRAYGEKWERSG